MKTVFSSTDEMLHIYASQTQERGKSGNVFFEGKICYSYGYHFPMSKIIDKKTILITNRTCSITTSKHLSALRYAVNHYNIIYVSKVDAITKSEHLANLAGLFNDFNITLKKYVKGRNKDAYLISLKHQIINIKHYATKLNLNLDNSQTKLIKEFNTPEFYAKVLAQIKYERQAKKEEQLKLKQEKESEINKWLNNESNHFPFGIDEIKLRIKDDIIETSKGAKVPLKESKIFYAILKEYLQTKREELKEKLLNKHLGAFIINKITDNQIIIGCHKIQFSELKRVFA